MRTFVYVDGQTSKFWHIEMKVTSFVVQWGDTGTPGQTQTKTFPDAAQGRKAHDQLIAEMLAQGYTETTTGRRPATNTDTIAPMAQMLEKAIAANPHDRAAHAAYADYLLEQNDPRGELLQTQLALEDPTRPAAERKRLQAVEKKLLNVLGPQLLGPLWTVMNGDWCGPAKPYHYEVTHGWVTTFRTLPFPDGIIALLAHAPEMRQLLRLEIVYDMEYHPWSFDAYTRGPNKALKALDQAEDAADDDGYDSDWYEDAAIMEPLNDSAYLGQLRAFKLGFSDREDDYAHTTMMGIFNNCNAPNILSFVAKCPRLEEFYLNTGVADVQLLFAYPQFHHLRVLQYYYGIEHYGSRQANPYPLSVLAENPSLGNLETLKFHPGRDATLHIDDVKALLHAPNLPKLRHLQLHMTTYGDEHIEPIIQSKIMQRLKVLDLGYGNMTDDGAARLASCPDVKHLEYLNVARNCLTAQGIKALQATGVRLNADAQHDDDDTAYLYEVDRE